MSQFEIRGKYPLWVKKVKALDEWQKLMVYNHYNCTMITLKNNFVFIDKTKSNWKHGWGEPDKEYLGLSIYFLWGDIKILDFESFISDKNIVIRDCGEEWDKHGFAQRWWMEPYGIYDWYWKHESEFNFT